MPIDWQELDYSLKASCNHRLIAWDISIVKQGDIHTCGAYISVKYVVLAPDEIGTTEIYLNWK